MMDSCGYTHTIWFRMVIGQLYGHLPLTSVSRRVYVASMHSVKMMVKIFIARLPGFAFIDESKRSLGCERNFTTERCKEGINTMKEVPNTMWENGTYSLPLLLPTKEECRNACLQDCNSEAALFKDGACSKQRLPLRFGRRQQTDSNIALIKLPTSSPSTDKIVPKERKKEVRVDILIISISLIGFAFIVMAISGIAIYRSRLCGKPKGVS